VSADRSFVLRGRTLTVRGDVPAASWLRLFSEWEGLYSAADCERLDAAMTSSLEPESARVWLELRAVESGEDVVAVRELPDILVYVWTLAGRPGELPSAWTETTQGHDARLSGAGAVRALVNGSYRAAFRQHPPRGVAREVGLRIRPPGRRTRPRERRAVRHVRRARSPGRPDDGEPDLIRRALAGARR
jgi:hypothetical protein